MSDRQLILRCALGGSRDIAAVQQLLKQYGLVAEPVGRGLTAVGAVPSVLDRMREGDIEAHLVERIEDAAPGTRVSTICATFVPPDAE